MPRKYSAAFKFEVVRQLDSGEKRLTQVCREHDLDQAMVRDWRERVGKRGADAFPRSTGTDEGRLAPGSGSELAGAQARIGDLERLLGRMSLENDFLKKALRGTSSTLPKGMR